MTPRISGALVWGCLSALVCVGCSEGAPQAAGAGKAEPAAATSAREASATVGEAPARDEIDVALDGRPLDASALVGTYELGPSGGRGRLVLLGDGAALTCTDEASPCTPDLASTPRHPYALVANDDGSKHYLVLHTSASDPAPFLVYALQGAAGDGGATLTLDQLLPKSGGSLSARKLPCSEMLYLEGDADHACAYYQCKFDQAGCSYFSDFGLPYCKKFYETHFDDATFSPRVRHCLQEAIRDEMDGMACDQVEQTAFQSHVACYIAGGFCSLSAADKMQIIDTIDVQDWNLANASTAVQIEGACASASQ
jgi:hypothetical protein